jgi:hypothetical protein
MEDIIDIIVTETTNTIEITSQSTDEVIDVNIIDNREDITLNVTPTVVEININSLTGNFGVEWGDITGTLADQTDLNTALGLKADLVGGKVPSSQLPSYVDDVIEVANYAALPATGETGKIYVTLDTNKIYRWSGSAYVEIVDSAAVWGAITGTLSSQTDLQSALNAKFDDPTGDTTQYIAGDGTLITFPVAGQAGTLVREVRNTTGATLTKGTIVYISGATGNKPTVSKAIATGDSTSAQTFGMLQANIANNANGYAVCSGDLSGLDTSALTEGQQLYLSGVTAGAYTTTKSVAPIHLVYIGVVTRSHPTQGQIEVKIQNGYELDEIHDVLITSKANNDGLFYESSTSLWKNKSIATVLGYSPEQPLTFSSPLSRSTNAVSIPAATTSVNGYLTSTDWTTFNAKQAALSGTGFVKISGTTISYDNSTYVTTSDAASTYLPLSGGIMTGQIVLKEASSSTDYTKGLRFPNDPFGGNADKTGIRLYSSSGENQVFEIYIGNDSSLEDIINFATGVGGTPDNNSVKINGNTIWNAGNLTPQTQLNGTGFVKISGTTITYDNSTYLTTSSASSTYLPLSGGTLTGALIGTKVTLSQSNTSGIIDNNAFIRLINTGTSTLNQSIDLVMRWQDGTYNGTGGISMVRESATARNGKLIFQPIDSGGNNISALTLLSTGAATFSNNVTANYGGVFIIPSESPATGNVALIARTSNGGNDIFRWFDGTTQLGVFKNSGSVGIGTASPSDFIDATSGLAVMSTSGRAGITIGSTTTTADEVLGRLSFTNTNSTNAGSKRLAAISGIRGTTNNSAYLEFVVANDGLGSQVMTLNQSGYLTIGGLRLKGSDTANTIYNANSNMAITCESGYNISIGRSSDVTKAINVNTTNGNVTIGDTSTSNTAKLNYASSGVGSYNGVLELYHSTSNVSGSGYMNFYINSSVIGSIGQVGSTAVAYYTTSDYRLKEDLKPINGLEIVNKIKVYDYKWKAEDSRMDGVLAHELQEILPYAVFGEKDGKRMQGVDYSKIVPVLIQAIKDQQVQIEQLKNK